MMKKTLALLMALSLMVFCLSAAGAETPKEEVVYGMLDASGAVNALYVVNILSGGGDLLDYGDYTDVENLTGTEAITQNGDEITVHTDAERFYYQGTPVDAALPWSMAVTYTLDGETVTPEALAGQSGELALTIATTRNPDANETFFNNFALQITVTLDTALCENIQADGATVAHAAGAKQISFTVLPGQKATSIVQATVHGFAMDAITLNGVRMNLNLSVDRDALTEQLTQLSDAVAALDSGAGDLESGASQLANGLTQYTAGVSSLTDGLSALADGAGELDDGAASLRDGLSGLTAQNEALLAAAQALEQATFDTVNQQLSAQGLPTLTPENYTQVLGAVPALADVQAQLSGVTQFVAGLTAYLDGVAQLSDGAATLTDGTAQLSGSLSALPDSAETLNTSGSDLATGAESLSDGLTAYREGTGELATQTAGMPDAFNAQIDEALGSLTGGGDDVVSFVSERNTAVSAVQFILKTEAIRLPETQAETEPEAETQTFWQKLAALFGG